MLRRMEDSKVSYVNDSNYAQSDTRLPRKESCMTSMALIPQLAPPPGPAWWLEALLLLTFILHLLLMNAVLGGTVIAAVQTYRLPTHAQGLVRDFGARLPTALALAINLGIPPLLFMQVLYGQFLNVSSVLMAVWWIGIIGLVMLAYYGLYIFAIGHNELGHRRLAVLLVCLLLLLGTSFVFSNNMTLMLNPPRWSAWFSQRNGTLLNLADPTLIPRWLHMVTGAIAIGGLALSLFHSRRTMWNDPAAQHGMREGLKWFSHATALQVMVGVWFLMSLPRPVMLGFMGGDPVATAALVLGLLGTGLCLAAGFKGKLAVSVGAGIGTVAVMAVMRAKLRTFMLTPWVIPQAEAPQELSPLVLFIASLVFGIVSIIYMLRLMRSPGREA